MDECKPLPLAPRRLQHDAPLRVLDRRGVVAELRVGRRAHQVRRVAGPSHSMQLELSVGDTSVPDLLETEGLFTQGSRPGRTFGESVGGTFEKDSSDWLQYLRYQTRH